MHIKKIIVLIALLLISTFLLGQDAKEENTKPDTSISKTGVMIKIINYSLPEVLKSNEKKAWGYRSNVRKTIIGGEIVYAYRIYDGSKFADIAYDDLPEVIKTIETLKTQSGSDKSLNPDYLENKFVGGDGLEVGYYISEDELTWFVDSKSGCFLKFKDISFFQTSLKQAKTKIESLKR